MDRPFNPAELYALSPWAPGERVAALAAAPVALDAAVEASPAWRGAWSVRRRRGAAGLALSVAAEARRVRPGGRDAAARAWAMRAALNGPDRLVAALRAVSEGMGG